MVDKEFTRSECSAKQGNFDNSVLILLDNSNETDRKTIKEFRRQVYFREMHEKFEKERIAREDAKRRATNAKRRHDRAEKKMKKLALQKCDSVAASLSLPTTQSS